MGHDLIIDAIEFELEKQERSEDIGELLVDIAIEFCPFGVGGVADVI